MQKIFKKSLALAVSAALCLTAFIGCLTVNAAGEASNPSYVVEDVTGAPGDTVKIVVKGSNLTKICGQLLDVKLGNGLTFVKAYNAKGELLPISDPVGDGDYNLINGSDGSTIVRFVEIINFRDETPTENFDLTIEATIPEEAAAGTTYDVTLDGQFANIKEEWVVVDIKNGVVTVESGEPAEPIPADDLKIRSAAIVLENGFALNYRVRKSVIDGNYTDPYIVFKKALYNAEGVITGYDETTVYFDSVSTDDENYIFTMSGIYPQEIGSDITATIYGLKDGVTYIGATVEYSVLTFATNQLKGTASNETKTALADMLNYGAAVQILSNYNTNNLVTDKATEIIGNEDWKAFATDEIDRELINAQTNTPLDGANVRIRSAALQLEDRVIMNFNCSDLDVTTITNPENYLLKVEYTDNYGLPKNFELKLDSAGKASFDKLVSTEMGIVVKATMIDAETKEAVSNTVTYSIETYISKNLDNPTYGDVCTALIKYGDAVRAYAGLN